MSQPQSVFPKVGQPVQYLGHENTVFAAHVIMTAESYDPDKNHSGSMEPADATSVSLLVIRPSGRPYARHNVPLHGSEAYQALVAAQAEFDATANAELQAELTTEELAETPKEVIEAYYAENSSRPVIRSWQPIPA